MVEDWQNIDEEKKKRNLKSTYNPAEITPSNILVQVLPAFCVTHLNTSMEKKNTCVYFKEK